MFNNLDSSFNANTSLPVSCRRMGLMDCLVWWDEETSMVNHTECTLAARSR
jgi:hypothetical protein